MLNVGDKAPDFKLAGIDSSGNESEYSLGDLLSLGKEVIIYFYPKDNTPGCTTEACDFRDHLETLNRTVVGISKDSIVSHSRFREKHGLNFILLSDPDHIMQEAYGVWGEKKLYGKVNMGTIRSTYVIDQSGIIKDVWTKVKAKGHVEAIIDKINQ